ncbi:UPF0538 protein C2orf76 homolog [Lineus longissimus]|uniref:UPF0538 protein C2orf76 homolog n=1 Tax=Lineus longissimus TaxID=88925 RepID=UPI002B4DB6C5
MADGPVVLTVRLIRSFEQRNIKHLVFQAVDLNQTVGDFMDLVNKDILTRPGIAPPVRKHAYDQMKIQHKAFGSKSTDPVIVLRDDDQLMLVADKTLAECGVENETEISYFKMEEYKKYKENPGLTW